MGAGDLKLMAAIGTIAGWQNWFGIFLVTAVLGGILAVLYSILKRRLGTTFWNVGFILTEIETWASGLPEEGRAGREELESDAHAARRGDRSGHVPLYRPGRVLYEVARPILHPRDRLAR